MNVPAGVFTTDITEGVVMPPRAELRRGPLHEFWRRRICQWLQVDVHAPTTGKGFDVFAYRATKRVKRLAPGDCAIYYVPGPLQ